MKAQIESQFLQEALRIALRLAPPLSESINISVDDSKMYIHSSSELARCSVLIPGKVEGSALFGVPVESLQSGIKGRAEIDMTYDKSMLIVKSGRYLAKLATVDATQVEHEQEKGETKKWKLDGEQATWLKKAVQQVALKPSSVTTTYMPMSVSLNEKAAFVSCYDTNHMAFIKSKDVKGDLEITLPVDTFNAVLDVFNNSSFTMSVGSSSLRIKNKAVDAMLSLPDSDSEEVISIKDVMSKAKEAVATEGLSIEAPRSDVAQFLDNSRAVIAKERSELLVQGEAGKLTLSVETTNGQIKSSVKASIKKVLKFKIDCEYFTEAVTKSNTDVLNMRLVGDSFLMIQSKDTYFVIALNQES